MLLKKKKKKFFLHQQEFGLKSVVIYIYIYIYTHDELSILTYEGQTTHLFLCLSHMKFQTS